MWAVWPLVCWTISSGCTEGTITQVVISDPAFPFGYDETQFDLCLDIPVLKDNLNAICEKVDDDEFQKIILKKLLLVGLDSWLKRKMSGSIQDSAADWWFNVELDFVAHFHPRLLCSSRRIHRGFLRTPCRCSAQCLVLLRWRTSLSGPSPKSTLYRLFLGHKMGAEKEKRLFKGF